MKIVTKLLVTQRLRHLLLALLCAATLTSPKPAQAITGGLQDGNAHPYVGMVVFYDVDGVRLFRCSGTLLSSTVFLTAGHCVEGDESRIPARARIYFNSNVVEGQDYVEGNVVKNPGYAWLGSLPLPVLNDVGLVILNEPLVMPVYGVLATTGTLNQLTGPAYKNLTFDVVGYGVQDLRPDVQADKVRYWATPKRISEKNAMVSDIYINHSANSGQVNNGGSCFGDSGGPIFLQGTSTIVGVTSWGIDPNCAAPGFGYRTDIDTSLDFLAPYASPPSP